MLDRDLFDDLAVHGAVIAGVLSGTSADGIDVALVRPEFAPAQTPSGPPALRRVVCVAFATEPFEAELGERMRSALDGRDRPGPRELALLDRDLGRAFGRAAREVARRHGYRLALVASHGQTLWHHDGVEPSGPATLQLGDGDEVAEAAGAAVACDFRRRDIAAGGEGAPLSALADPVIFAHVRRPLALLNLGGIANLTLLRRAEGADDAAADEVVAFDVGPANALLDGLARRLLGRPFDADGATAAAGKPLPALVDHLLAHPFFTLAPPKSTGRDTFGAGWLDGVVAAARALGPAPDGVSTEDVLASAAVAVARSVAVDLRRHAAWLGDGEDPSPLFVAGGGVHHRPLFTALAAELMPRRVLSSSAADVPPDAREGLVFAILGLRTLMGVPSTRPGATGAAPGRVLGKWVPAPPEAEPRTTEVPPVSPSPDG